MFDNIAIDIAIGLILMYLVLSLVCTVINEFIATQLDLRAKSLAAGLAALIDDEKVRNAFYDHGVISGTQVALQYSSRALARFTSLFGKWKKPVAAPAPAAATRVPGGGPAVAAPSTSVQLVTTPAPALPDNAPAAAEQPGIHPSYLSADTFVSAMIGCLTGTSVAQGHTTPTFAQLKTAIEDLPPSKIKGALLANLMTAQNDLAKFQQGLATWFDDSMERLSGAYKRHLKVISLVVGCLVAVVMNADTFAVGYALWSKPAVAAQMVGLAAGAVDKSLKNPAGSTPSDVATAFTTADAELRPLLPIGWPVTLPDGGKAQVWFWLTKVIGWFVTALALSLGAPFWFDLLGQFMNLRGSGPKPARADAK
jgi:hypothetical protein